MASVVTPVRISVARVIVAAAAAISVVGVAGRKDKNKSKQNN
jgi:hypothetical protein